MIIYNESSGTVVNLNIILLTYAKYMYNLGESMKKYKEENDIGWTLFKTVIWIFGVIKIGIKRQIY